MNRILMYLNTLRYLKIKQIFYQCIRRIKPKRKGQIKLLKQKLKDISILIEELDYNVDFISRFDIDLIFERKIKLLNQIVELTFTEKYLSSLSPLLRNNILYMEYAIGLGVKYRQTKDNKYVEAFIKIYKSFIDSEIKGSSYIYAMHIPNILISIQLFGAALPEEFISIVYEELYTQYGYIKANLEKHLLANHYLEDIKAIILASLVFDERKTFFKYLGILGKELKEQINEDGLHYELSPMYHKIILEDLLRVYVSLRELPKQRAFLFPILEKMSDAAITFESGFNRTPLFNDSGDNVAKPLSAIVDAVKRILDYEPVKRKDLTSSGYYKLSQGNLCLIFDAGKPGVPYQPGHVQNDCLSFELALKGKPLFVNCGTYAYQGKYREFFRSTSAHNTFQIEGIEQSECWGEHRVARRYNLLGVRVKNNEISASYKGWNGVIYSRLIILKKDTLTVIDTTTNSTDEKVRSFLHLPPGYDLVKKESSYIISGVGEITTIACTLKIHDTGQLVSYAPDFGKLLKGKCLEFTWNSDNTLHGFEVKFYNHE